MTFELAIGVSGGLDSTVAYLYAQEELGIPQDKIIPVHLNLRHPYWQKEQVTLRAIGIPAVVLPVPVVPLQNAGVTKENQIIPGRNMIIASVLASLAPQAWIVGTKWDSVGHVSDKCQHFYDLMGAAASQAMGHPVTIRSPFTDTTKEELLGWAILHGHEAMVRKTVSCYDPNLLLCGNCIACVHRAIAFYRAGMHKRWDYTEDPFRSVAGMKQLSQYEQALTEGRYDHYLQERVVTHLEVYRSEAAVKED